LHCRGGSVGYPVLLLVACQGDMTFENPSPPLAL
jgi:hypothetical protein